MSHKNRNQSGHPPNLHHMNIDAKLRNASGESKRSQKNSPEALPSHNGLEEEAVTLPCYCVCHTPISSNAYCEHCKGDNEVGRHHGFAPTPPNEVDEYSAVLDILVNAIQDKKIEIHGVQPHGRIGMTISNDVTNSLAALITKQNQAYGGCTKCYGKGYATWRHGETYHGRTSDMRTEMKYCTCDRGKQLEELVTEKQSAYHAATTDPIVQTAIGWYNMRLHKAAGVKPKPEAAALLAAVHDYLAKEESK